MMACFSDARRDQIRGFDNTGNPIDPNTLGGDDAACLEAMRKIQNIKMLFCKLKKSFMACKSSKTIENLACTHKWVVISLGFRKLTILNFNLAD